MNRRVVTSWGRLDLAASPARRRTPRARMDRNQLATPRRLELAASPAAEHLARAAHGPRARQPDHRVAPAEQLGRTRADWNQLAVEFHWGERAMRRVDA